MFTYELVGKEVVLILRKEMLPDLRPLGITGSPLYAQVHAAEERGLWLDNPSFPLCPLDQPRLHDARGRTFCHAHVFLPAEAIVALAVFPQRVGDPGEESGMHRIGFRL